MNVFFLEDPTGGQHGYDIDAVKESLQFMLQQLRFFALSEEETEYDLSLIDQDLVFWELEPEDDWYETTTAERIATTIGEVEYQLEVLGELEDAQLGNVDGVEGSQDRPRHYSRTLVNWKVEGF